jgi:hypothetical protein
MQLKILLTVALMVMGTDAFAVTRIYKTVKPSGGDYTTLQAAITAQAQDLVANDSYLDIEIDGDWSGTDNSAAGISGYTTDATHYINIYTTSAARHHGVYSTSYYRIVYPTDNGSSGIWINNNYVRITGIQINMSSASNTYGSEGIHVGVDPSSGIVLDKLIIKVNKGGAAIAAGYDGSITLKNSVLMTDRASGEVLRSYGSLDKIYNVVAIATNASNTTSVFNSLGYNVDIYNSYGHTAGSGNVYSSNISKYNTASSDTSGSTGLQSIAYSTSSGAYFTNVTPGSENFTIGSSSALKGVGWNLYGIFTDDIAGTTRTYPWDIGVFHVSSEDTSHPNYCDDSGIVLCHPMKINESPLQDVSANNHDGTLVGTGGGNSGPAYDTAAPGSLSAGNYIFSTSGGTDRIDFGDSAAFSPEAGASGTMTIMAWVRFTSVRTDQTWPPSWIFAKGGSSQYEFGIGQMGDVNSSPRMRMRWWTSSGQDIATSDSNDTTIVAGTWYHFAVIFDRAGNLMRMYLNGAPDVSVTASSYNSTDQTANLNLGAREADGNLDANMTEFAMFNRVLTQPEIAEIMNFGLQGSGNTPSTHTNSLGGNMTIGSGTIN